LAWLSHALAGWWGPLRLFDSYFFLASAGFATAAVAAFLLLPRLAGFLPRDGGRAFAVNAELSVGKPVGAGLIFVSIFAVLCVVFTHLTATPVRTVPVMLAAMVVGFLDDRRPGGFGEYTLGALDLALALATACLIYGFGKTTMWLPLVTQAFSVPAWIAIPLGTGVVWLSINATNCSDGVDGVSGSLAAVAILLLGGLLYTVIGNEVVAGHLRIPASREGADWSIMALVMAGCLAGYLWYNAPPSSLLMGDAGSRPLGLLIGMLVLATNNPLFILIIGPVILLNGATGLVKVALIRFLRVRVLSGIRFPLHDHCRKELGWSNSQVLVRFFLLHVGVSSLLVLVALKIR
jgi:phospho-N-acetylmuramoyl-pentapeptide-transferase